MKLVGRWLAIQCFKHDGAVHRTWDRGLVLENNEGRGKSGSGAKPTSAVCLLF